MLHILNRIVGLEFAARYAHVKLDDTQLSLWIRPTCHVNTGCSALWLFLLHGTYSVRARRIRHENNVLHDANLLQEVFVHNVRVCICIYILCVYIYIYLYVSEVNMIQCT